MFEVGQEVRIVKSGWKGHHDWIGKVVIVEQVSSDSLIVRDDKGPLLVFPNELEPVVVPQLTRRDVEAIIEQVDISGFGDWWFVVRNFDGSLFDNQPFYLQIRMREEDHDSPGQVVELGCRKWYISPYMTESEVVQTALRATLDAVEHEARETFKYKGKALYGPHISVAAHLYSCGNIDARGTMGR